MWRSGSLGGRKQKFEQRNYIFIKVIDSSWNVFLLKISKQNKQLIMPQVTKLLQQLVKFISIKSAQLNLNKRNSYIFCNFFGIQWADRKQVFSFFLHVLWQISNANLKSPSIYLELCTILILFDFLFTYSTCNV